MLALSKMKLYGHDESQDDNQPNVSPYESTKKGKMYLEHNQLLNTIYRSLTDAPAS